MSFRELCYRYNVFRSYSFPVPVISVGNLTMGGTGKTPMVSMLAGELQKLGYTPAIISRGYGGSAKEKVNVVSGGKKPLLSVEDAGDEPFLLASTLPGVPVLTGKKRVFPGRQAIMDYGADLLILDDGFQHLSVKRDINIVLFNSTTLAGNSRVFPGGDLREPVKSLGRADIFVLTGVTDNTAGRAAAFQELLQKRFPETPVCLAGFASPSLIDANGDTIEKKHLPGPVIAFSGIAVPERFFTSLEKHGITTEANHAFRDHVHYGSSELNTIRKLIDKHGGGCLVTTLKDQVKLRHTSFDIPLYYLSNETEPAAPLLDFVRHKLSLHNESLN